jgi:hypothetical protein
MPGDNCSIRREWGGRGDTVVEIAPEHTGTYPYTQGCHGQHAMFVWNTINVWNIIRDIVFF